MTRAAERATRPARELAALAALAASVALGPGCGWQTGQLVPAGIDSIGVEFFDNTTRERDLEIFLTDELGRALANLVDRPLVPPARADAVVRGRVVEFRRRSGARSEDNVLLETGITITVEAQLVRRSTGEELASTRSSIISNYPIDPVHGARRDDPEARSRALRYIAEEVVLDLFGPASYKALDRSE